MTQTTLIPALDRKRIMGAQARVAAFMADHQWHTLRAIADVCRTSEAGASARLREMRRECQCGLDCKTEQELADHLALNLLLCGRTVVERRRQGDPKSGVWVYRVAK